MRVNKRVRTVLLVLVLLVVATTLTSCAPTGQVDLNKPQGFWQTFIVFPLAHALRWLNSVIGSIGIPYSYGWAIIIFTIIVKLVTLPLTLQQLRSTKATQELQPKLSELQQKYGKDRQKLSEEQMKLYREAGINPMGGCLPLLIQMPILFGLYQALYILANSGDMRNAAFLWIQDLAYPDATTGLSWLGVAFGAHDWGKLITYLSLPVLLLITQIMLQKMMQPVQTNPSQQNDQQRMMGQMTLFMPLFLSYIFLMVPAGLSLYYLVSNLLSIIQQYFVTGWGSLVSWVPALGPRRATVVSAADGSAATSRASSASASAAALDKPKRRQRRK